MITSIISALILAVPCVTGGVFFYWLWKQGVLGRIFLLGLFCLTAVEVHSVIFPQKQLKESYARVIG